LCGTPAAGPTQSAATDGPSNKTAVGPTDPTFCPTAPAAATTSAAAEPAEPQRRNGSTVGQHKRPCATSDASIRSRGRGARAADSPGEAAPTSNKQPDATDSAWFEIEDMIKHRKVKGVLHYLVKWKDAGRDWVPVYDITQAALDAYYVKRQSRTRRRRRRR